MKSIKSFNRLIKEFSIKCRVSLENIQYISSKFSKLQEIISNNEKSVEKDTCCWKSSIPLIFLFGKNTINDTNVIDSIIISFLVNNFNFLNYLFSHPNDHNIVLMKDDLSKIVNSTVETLRMFISSEGFGDELQQKVENFGVALRNLDLGEITVQSSLFSKFSNIADEINRVLNGFRSFVKGSFIELFEKNLKNIFTDFHSLLFVSSILNMRANFSETEELLIELFRTILDDFPKTLERLNSYKLSVLQNLESNNLLNAVFHQIFMQNINEFQNSILTYRTSVYDLYSCFTVQTNEVIKEAISKTVLNLCANYETNIDKVQNLLRYILSLGISSFVNQLCSTIYTDALKFKSHFFLLASILPISSKEEAYYINLLGLLDNLVDKLLPTEFQAMISACDFSSEKYLCMFELLGKIGSDKKLMSNPSYNEFNNKLLYTAFTYVITIASCLKYKTLTFIKQTIGLMHSTYISCLYFNEDENYKTLHSYFVTICKYSNFHDLSLLKGFFISIQDSLRFCKSIMKRILEKQPPSLSTCKDTLKSLSGNLVQIIDLTKKLSSMQTPSKLLPMDMIHTGHTYLLFVIKKLESESNFAQTLVEAKVYCSLIYLFLNGSTYFIETKSKIIIDRMLPLLYDENVRKEQIIFLLNEIVRIVHETFKNLSKVKSIDATNVKDVFGLFHNKVYSIASTILVETIDVDDTMKKVFKEKLGNIEKLLTYCLMDTGAPNSEEIVAFKQLIEYVEFGVRLLAFVPKIITPFALEKVYRTGAIMLITGNSEEILQSVNSICEFSNRITGFQTDVFQTVSAVFQGQNFNFDALFKKYSIRTKIVSVNENIVLQNFLNLILLICNFGMSVYQFNQEFVEDIVKRINNRNVNNVVMFALCVFLCTSFSLNCYNIQYFDIVYCLLTELYLASMGSANLKRISDLIRFLPTKFEEFGDMDQNFGNLFVLIVKRSERKPIDLVGLDTQMGLSQYTIETYIQHFCKSRFSVQTQPDVVCDLYLYDIIFNIRTCASGQINDPSFLKKVSDTIRITSEHYQSFQKNSEANILRESFEIISSIYNSERPGDVKESLSTILNKLLQIPLPLESSILYVSKKGHFYYSSIEFITPSGTSITQKNTFYNTRELYKLLLMLIDVIYNRVYGSKINQNTDNWGNIMQAMETCFKDLSILCSEVSDLGIISNNTQVLNAAKSNVQSLYNDIKQLCPDISTYDIIYNTILMYIDSILLFSSNLLYDQGK